MKINIYPIVSALHDKNVIENNTNELLSLLKENSKHDYNIVSIDELYDADLSLILVLSGGSENEFLSNLPKLREPFYILTYGYNNSLPASLEILSYIKDNNYDGEVLHGNINYIVDRINDLLNRVNYGVIGNPSDWLIASEVNYSNALKHNVNLINIDIDEVVKEYNSITELDDLSIHLDYDKKEIDKANKLYRALVNIKQKYNLKGLTIRCFDLLSKLNTTACLGLSLLNRDKTISTCEGDIPSMISMKIIYDLFKQSSFQANPSQINLEENEIVFAHCTLPLDMCNSFKLDTHFESNIGIGIKGELNLTKVTIFKLARNLKDYYVETGTIVENLNSDKLCRTQIKIKLDNSPNYFLTRPYGNHHIIFYGDHKNELIEYMNKIK